MAKITNIVIPILAFLIFIIGIINFGINLADVNDSPQSILDDPSLRKYTEDINETGSNVVNEANAGESIVGNSTITSGGQSNFLDSTPGLWKTITRSPKVVWTLTMNLIFTNLLGSSQTGVMLGLIGAIIIIILVIGIVQLVAQGRG